MTTKPPGRTSPPPLPPRSKQPSPLASQEETKAALLAEITTKSEYSNIPLIGWIESKFVRREVKSNYIKTLEEQFVESSVKIGWTRQNAWSVFNHYITPKLFATHLEDLPKIEAFWKLPHGIEAFLNIVDAFPKDSQTGIKRLTEMVDLAMAAVHKNPQGTAWVLSHTADVSFLMANRFTGSDKVEYVNTMLHWLINDPPDLFTRISKTMSDFLNESKNIQSERPVFYTHAEKLELLTLFDDIGFTILKHEVPLIRHVYTEIYDMTVDRNSQGIQENLARYYSLATGARPNPELKKRYADSPLSLSLEKHVPIQMLKDSDEVIDFNGAIDLYLTNEKTMETRSLYLPLPFKGKMTHTQARRSLELLREAINGPKAFDESYEKLKFDPQLKEEMQKTFLEWASYANQEFWKLTLDFNPTPTRPVMSYALETPAAQEALRHPLDPAKAIEVAKAKNIYLVDGRMSLLPKPLAANHPQIAQIAPSELRESVQLLKGAKTQPIALRLTSTRTAAVTLDVQLTDYRKTPAIQLNITFREGSEVHTRTTTYLLEDNQNMRDRLNEVVASGLFERDLLLAKAEFLGEHGQL